MGFNNRSLMGFVWLNVLVRHLCTVVNSLKMVLGKRCWTRWYLLKKTSWYTWKKEIKCEMEALTQVWLCAFKGLLFFSWISVGLIKAVLFPCKFCLFLYHDGGGHLSYRNHVDNHGANNEISSFFILPFLLPVETGKPALSAVALTSA